MANIRLTQISRYRETFSSKDSPYGFCLTLRDRVISANVTVSFKDPVIAKNPRKIFNSNDKITHYPHNMDVQKTTRSKLDLIILWLMNACRWSFAFFRLFCTFKVYFHIPIFSQFCEFLGPPSPPISPPFPSLPPCCCWI